jgi:hypothetical protein
MPMYTELATSKQKGRAAHNTFLAEMLRTLQGRTSSFSRNMDAVHQHHGEHCLTNRNVADSIPDDVTGIFH